MIQFKKISYKNFLSTGNVPIVIDLNKSHLTLIIGSNGSGKSTLLDALCFALFNRPFRIIKKDQMVNTINNGGCEVELYFSVGPKEYIVRRGVKPNFFEIHCNGELISQDASTIDYQKYLETNIMRCNYRSFCQVVLLGSSSYQPFMKMRASFRREVVEEILDIRAFTRMDHILRGQQSDLQNKITEVRHHCELIETKYQTEAKYLDTLLHKDIDVQTHKKRVLDKNEEDRLAFVKKIKELNEDIISSKECVKDRDKVDMKTTTLSKLEAKIENNLTRHRKSLKFFEENDVCPTCTQPLHPTFKHQKCDLERKKINTLKEGMKKLLQEIVNMETKVGEYNKVSEKIYNLNVDLSKVETSLESLKSHSDNIEEDLKVFQNKDADIIKIRKDLQDMKDSLKVCKEDLDKVIEDKKYQDVLRQVLNDKGAKAQIIKKYIPIMNNLINKYLQAMDFYVSFHLDEEFNETVKSRFRDTFNYNNFSEGEKMRIDLALLFTWRDIARLKNSTNTNLLILDEIFDSSLDMSGTDDFFKIIQKLSNENVFIISHKGDIMFDKFTNIVKYKKHQNFTVLDRI